MAIKGLALLSALQLKAESKGHKFSDACSEMGVSQTFLSSVFSAEGGPSIDSLDTRTLRSIATYLDVPLAQVLFLADILAAEDFMIQRTMDQDLAAVYTLLVNDPLWSDITPPLADFTTLTPRFKFLIALLYEQYTGRSLLRKAEATGLIGKKGG